MRGIFYIGGRRAASVFFAHNLGEQLILYHNIYDLSTVLGIFFHLIFLFIFCPILPLSACANKERAI